MNLTLLSTLRLGKRLWLVSGILGLAWLGCDTHPLLNGYPPTGTTYVGTETNVATTPSGQTYTATHTIPMVTLPTSTQIINSDPAPTTNFTNTYSSTYPTTTTNTLTPTWPATEIGTATVTATYTTGTSTWTATAPVTDPTGTNTRTITVTSANRTNTFTAIVAIPPTATYVTTTWTNSLTATTTRTISTRTPTSSVTSTATSTTGSQIVTFSNGQAQGPMAGWGWVAGGSLDKISSPGCMSTPISPSSPCTTGYLWNSPNALCLTGAIPALPAAPVQNDYDQNWGVMIGVNAKEPNGPIGFSFAGIDVSLSGQIAGTQPRLLLHLEGDPDSLSYCATLSGNPLPLSSFNTACWDLSGKIFNPALASKIDKIMVQVPSGYTAIAIRNLCLNSISFY